MEGCTTSLIFICALAGRSSSLLSSVVWKQVLQQWYIMAVCWSLSSSVFEGRPVSSSSTTACRTIMRVQCFRQVTTCRVDVSQVARRPLRLHCINQPHISPTILVIRSLSRMRWKVLRNVDPSCEQHCHPPPNGPEMLVLIGILECMQYHFRSCSITCTVPSETPVEIS